MTNTQHHDLPSAEPITWVAPDKGVWSCDTAHARTVSSVPMRALMERGFTEGFRASFAPLGVPLSHVETRYINGWPYMSFFMHDVPRGPGKPPPTLVLKALTRLHPGFRRRTKIATAAVCEGRPLRLVESWEGERDSWIQRNLEMQRVDLDRLDDDGLAEHLAYVTDVSGEALQHHFELVAGCIPLGNWLARCGEWGLPREAVRSAVMHSTPVHVEAGKRLDRISLALAGAAPTDLDEVRAHSAEAAAALDDYLDHHGWWGTADTLDCSRVMDHAAIVLAAIRANRPDASRPDAHAASTLLAEMRAQVPEADRAEFDQLARDAHRSHMMLDDNSGILSSWCFGIAGEVYRAAGRRLVERGRVRNVDDVWALTIADTVSLLTGHATPSAADVARSVAVLHAQAELSPPKHLNGEPSPPPAASVFPAPVAQLMAGIGAFLDDKLNDAQQVSGIGSRTVTGRAVVVLSASDAFDRLEPGDILVTTATTPSFNAVLPIVGGLVVTEGGLSCHAAIMARELDVPAIVGLSDALTTIPDGAVVTLDPLRARVSIVASAVGR